MLDVSVGVAVVGSIGVGVDARPSAGLGVDRGGYGGGGGGVEMTGIRSTDIKVTK